MTARKTRPVKIKPSIADFMNQLTSLHAHAHSLGLHRTGHALHEAVRIVGYEVEALITPAPQRRRKS